MPSQMSGKAKDRGLGWVWGCMVTCCLWVSGTAGQGLRSLEALAAARVMYIVHDYCADCFCSSVLLLRLNNEIVMLAAFFSWPNAQFEEG